MAAKGYCGKECGICEGCYVDGAIPCSPDCQNLTRDGKIKVLKCLESGCEEVKHIFDMKEVTDEEIVKQYGEIAEYPYSY